MGAALNARPTGRRVRGAIADQIEVTLEGLPDARATVVLFAEDYRDDPALAKVDTVPGLVARGVGAFAFRAIGRTARELAIVLAEDGGAGPRAALQLLLGAVEALDRTPHGNLSPWHLLVEPDGTVHAIGSGLPALDVLDYLADAELVPSLRTLRYCPPERLEGAEEDETSELYALVLIAAEVATGLPVYAGKRAQVLEAAAAGDAGQCVEDLTELPADVLRLFRAMLAPYAEDRADPKQWLEAARVLLSELEGPSLAEMVQEASQYLSDDELELDDPAHTRRSVGTRRALTRSGPASGERGGERHGSLGL